MERNAIGNVLKAKRKQNNYSVKDIVKILAEKDIPVAEKTVYSWESGHRQPDADTFMILCSIYKITDILTEFGAVSHQSDMNALSGLSVNSSDDNDDKMSLSSHEKKVILAYKAQPEMQPPVDKLLGVEDKSESKPASAPNVEGEEMVRVFRAARSDNHTEGGWVEIPKWQMDILKNAEPDEGDF